MHIFSVTPTCCWLIRLPHSRRCLHDEEVDYRRPPERPRDDRLQRDEIDFARCQRDGAYGWIPT